MNAIKRNHVKVRGNGKALMFAHGFGCDQNDWNKVITNFENTFQIISFDHVGSGSSDLAQYKKEKYSSFQGYADDVNEIIEELKLKDVTYVGHSAGAMIGVLAALAPHSAISKLVMVAASPHYINEENYKGGFGRTDIDGLLATIGKDHIGWANAMAPALMGNPERPELGAELAKSFARNRADIFHHFAQTIYLSDYRNDVAKLKIPTLILQCSSDLVVPDEVGNYLHAQIANSKFVQLKATGHFAHLSAPAELAKAISGFIAS